ncbi:MAG TPA: hypothetical protein DIT64_19890 [Verrucomicrobiales bacterium]|nr:hypothetical protein [Verrucomicrobiales bacterium]HCN76951.1 hypothetical protein [Verrucomicrobiales bacterium]HRJ10362.1 hypothetical protein [Prosthecobacter sp.]HRK15913.1 hypothetical protein [Prosthecobacter sp.]
MPESSKNAEGPALDSLEKMIAAKKQEAAATDRTLAAPLSSTSAAAGTTGATIKTVQNEQPWTPALVGGLSLGLMVFGVFIFCLITHLVKEGKVTEPAGDGQWLLRLMVVPLCVLAAVLLVIVGFSNEQTAPAVGLLGTIIGYLLGSGARGVAPVGATAVQQGATPSPPVKPSSGT